MMEPKRARTNGIVSSYSFLFLDTPGHYCMRKYMCWCKACSLVHGSGQDCVLRNKFLDVPGCIGGRRRVLRRKINKIIIVR